MRIAITERFQTDVRALDSDQRRGVFDLLLALPTALRTPHVHAGTGLRKIHRSGVWEARAGLSLRIVFTAADGVISLVRVGTHDDIRRFLRQL